MTRSFFTTLLLLGVASACGSQQTQPTTPEPEPEPMTSTPSAESSGEPAAVEPDAEPASGQPSTAEPPAPESVAAPPADATKTKSGLAYKVIRHGTGKAHPAPDASVEVHYSGWTTDGKLFDSSITRSEPSTFPVNGVIEGFGEGLQLLVEGDKAILWIPQELAYNGQPGPPAGMLVFEVELLRIVQ